MPLFRGEGGGGREGGGRREGGGGRREEGGGRRKAHQRPAEATLLGLQIRRLPGYPVEPADSKATLLSPRADLMHDMFTHLNQKTKNI